jgi:AraC family transcriptional activator of pobA
MKTIPVRSIQAVQSKNIEGFRIRRVADLLHGSDMIQDVHRHDFVFVVALRKGKGEHEIDFVSYKISDHCVFMLRPGQVHRIRLNATSEGYLMEFSKHFFEAGGKESKDLLRKALNKNNCKLNKDGSAKLQSILAAMFEEYSDRRENYQEALMANLTIFFIEVLRQRQHSSGIENITDQYLADRLDQFESLLEKHTPKHKLVSWYAGAMHLSPFQLNSITRKLLGRTASQVIDSYIILESKRSLLATPNQVNQIAYSLGFEDVSYFIRFFRKHTGQTPESFRQNSR